MLPLLAPHFLVRDSSMIAHCITNCTKNVAGCIHFPLIYTRKMIKTLTMHKPQQGTMKCGSYSIVPYCCGLVVHNKCKDHSPLHTAFNKISCLYCTRRLYTYSNKRSSKPTSALTLTVRIS
jgi:hypothetical protein